MNFEDLTPEEQHAVTITATALRNEQPNTDVIDAWGLPGDKIRWVLANLGMIEVIARREVGDLQAIGFRQTVLDGHEPEFVATLPEMEGVPASQIEGFVDTVITTLSNTIVRYADDLTELPADMGEIPPQRRSWLEDAFQAVWDYRQRTFDGHVNTAMVTAADAGFEMGEMTETGIPQGLSDYIHRQVAAPKRHTIRTAQDVAVAGWETVDFEGRGVVRVDVADLGVPSEALATIDVELVEVATVVAAIQAARGLSDLTSVGEFLLALQLADGLVHRNIVPDGVRRAAAAGLKASVNRVRNDGRVAALGVFLDEGHIDLASTIEGAAIQLGLGEFIDDARSGASITDLDLGELLAVPTGATVDDAVAAAAEAAVQTRRGIDATALWDRAAILWEQAGSPDAATRCRELGSTGDAGLTITWDSLEVRFLEEQ